jgi:hypothetical protein
MVIHRSGLAGRTMRIAVFAAAAATATMAGAVVGSLGYLAAAWAGSPSTSSTGWFAGYGVPMLLALVVCGVSSWRGLLALRPAA